MYFVVEIIDTANLRDVKNYEIKYQLFVRIFWSITHVSENFSNNVNMTSTFKKISKSIFKTKNKIGTIIQLDEFNFFEYLCESIQITNMI